MDDSSVVARHVLELLEGAEKKTLPGSQLAALVKFRFPGFKPVEHGCANLREFITKHLLLPSLRCDGKGLTSFTGQTSSAGGSR